MPIIRRSLRLPCPGILDLPLSKEKSKRIFLSLDVPGSHDVCAGGFRTGRDFMSLKNRYRRREFRPALQGFFGSVGSSHSGQAHYGHSQTMAIKKFSNFSNGNREEKKC